MRYVVHVPSVIMFNVPDDHTQADGFDPDWKAAFYGSNYARLLSIKNKYDPDQILYGATAVGGDRWVERPDGHLCRAN
jgi:hypothetical protein